MYFGNVRDFFYKNKNWLITQPKFEMKKSNLTEYIKIQGKYYKMDLSTGKLEIIKNSLDKKQKKFGKKIISKSSNQKVISLSTENRRKNDNKKRNRVSRNKNINLNKMQNLTMLTTFYRLKNKSMTNSIPRKITDTTASGVIPKTDRQKIDDKNLFPLKSRIVKNKIFNTNVKTLRYKTLPKNSNKKGLLYSLNRLREPKKDFSDIDEKNPADIFFDEDIYDLNKKENDSELVKEVKNQIFKNRIFHIMRKNYNFYNDSKTRLVKIPNINLAEAQSKFLENTKKDWSDKIYFLHKENLIKKYGSKN